MNKELLEEKKMHGDASFPLQVYLAEHRAGEIFEPHWHESLEIIYILSGSATFTIDDDKHELQAGDYLFVNSDKIHGATFSETCRFHAIVFDLKMCLGTGLDICNHKYFNRMLERQMLLPNVIDKNSAIYPDIQQWIRQLYGKYEQKSDGYELYAKGLLTLIMASLFEHGQMIEPDKNRLNKTNQMNRLKLALNYMTSHYPDTIPVKSLADLSNMSLYYFCRYFKSVTGCTPVEYLNRLRISKAETLLATTDKRVIDIAFEVGFNSLNYFSEMYRRTKGISPSEARERARIAAQNRIGV
ncbi:AraC family transcriptional regulator [Paenibacillus mendelii]|uniref:Helix-turn-helix domain-containing protein n=1 Tax=Paenibacillus mendelii TaxID=206163 RepID=A0ABV6JHY7_9BACL|nr:AraC family transcriptional regulator [Paenibacillus mendelii]MCQ6558417.1 AraC family transcriptional regulator [Paenibacillus mendelii]